MYVGSAALVSAMVGCGDLVNHDDTRPVRQVPVAAVYLDRGDLIVLLAPCKGSRVYRLAVTDGVNAGWSVIDKDPPNPATVIRLFVLPKGWAKETTGAGELPAMTKGPIYYVLPDLNSDLSTRTDDQAVNLRFTLTDLTSLRPDEVWAVPTVTAKPEAMTRAQFRRAAATTCDS